MVKARRIYVTPESIKMSPEYESLVADFEIRKKRILAKFSKPLKIKY